jgi:hypothetical protein
MYGPRDDRAGDPVGRAALARHRAGLAQTIADHEGVEQTGHRRPSVAGDKSGDG